VYPQKLFGSLPGWPSQGMQKSVDVGLWVQAVVVFEAEVVFVEETPVPDPIGAEVVLLPLG